ncbi:MAG: hypothetical protein K2K31_00875 [Clostridia bacterium]|nr:hypothetical protein [Clostridia bacterium]
MAKSLLREMFEPIVKDNGFLAALIDYKKIDEDRIRRIEEKRHREKMSVLCEIRNEIRR